MSFLVKESIPLCRLVAGDDVDSLEAEDKVLLFFLLEPEADPVEQVEAEPEERVEVQHHGVLFVECLVGGSLHLACLAEHPLILSFF